MAATVTVVSPIGQKFAGAPMVNLLPSMVSVWASRPTVTRWVRTGDG
ncbi:hypothetical protein [Streptomyces sp. NBC_01431]|nr:hypothetical protein [Streptomyces sp. NBC_01431]